MSNSHLLGPTISLIKETSKAVSVERYGIKGNIYRLCGRARALFVLIVRMAAFASLVVSADIEFFGVGVGVGRHRNKEKAKNNS